MAKGDGDITRLRYVVRNGAAYQVNADGSEQFQCKITFCPPGIAQGAIDPFQHMPRAKYTQRASLVARREDVRRGYVPPMDFYDYSI